MAMWPAPIILIWSIIYPAQPAPLAADPLETAHALFAEERFGEAEALLKRVLTENNENGAALILYARCLAERGELGEAEAVLNAVKGDEHKQALAADLHRAVQALLEERYRG